MIQLIKKVHVFRQGAWRSGEILIAWERSFRDGENMHCIQRIARCQSFQSFLQTKRDAKRIDPIQLASPLACRNRFHPSIG